MDFNDLPEVTPTPIDPFDALENLAAFQSAIPEGLYITLRHEANPPVYVNFAEGETTLTLAAAMVRRSLMTSGPINAFLDSNEISMDTPLSAGSVVMLVGNVKGG